MVEIIKGNIIFTETPDNFEVIENGYIVYEEGIILSVTKLLPEEYSDCEIQDYGNRLIIPGFYDLHVHSGQYSQCGVGMDLPLLQWLKKYTYQSEKRCENPSYARRLYEKFSHDLLRYGTLGAVVFSTTSYEGTEILFEEFLRTGIRGYIGMVEMERNAPEFIIKDLDYTMEMIESLINEYNDNRLVKAIITPRFAPTSTKEGLRRLGELAKKYSVPVQSHLDESQEEVEWVRSLYKKDYASVYDEFGLYGDTPTLMAHGVYMTDEEIDLTRDNGVILVHCPDSNINLSSGIMHSKELIEKGVRLGLGTDMAGGHKLFMGEVIVRAIQLSKLLTLQEGMSNKPLTFSEAFYMSTVVGGGFFGRMGKLKSGYELDCLIIDDDQLYIEIYSIEDRLSKFIYTGDDRWILDRYVSGKILNV